MKDSVQNDLAQLRQKKNVTQEALAAHIGVTRQTIIAIEKGNYTPSVMLALKLARYFKVHIEDIFY